MPDIIGFSLSAAIVAYLLYVAIEDYARLRIANRTVLVGILLYGLWAASNGGATLTTDVPAGVLLFALGFIFWLFKFVGAGDAKFMLVCGAFSGLENLPHFAIALVVVSLILFVLIKIAARPEVGYLLVLSRLGTISQSGKAPYGVPLAAATIYAFLLRMSGTISV